MGAPRAPDHCTLFPFLVKFEMCHPGRQLVCRSASPEQSTKPESKFEFVGTVAKAIIQLLRLSLRFRHPPT